MIQAVTGSDTRGTGYEISLLETANRKRVLSPFRALFGLDTADGPSNQRSGIVVCVYNPWRSGACRGGGPRLIGRSVIAIASGIKAVSMNMQAVEAYEPEQVIRPDGSKAERIPLSRRYYRFCLLLGLICLPVFGVAPFVVDSFSTIFTAAWVIFAALFFCHWLWGAVSYLRYADRFGIEIDSVGVRERSLYKEKVLKWADIESIELFGLEGYGPRVVGFRLKQPTWKRRWKLVSYDAVFLNYYAAPHPQILACLRGWQTGAG